MLKGCEMADRNSVDERRQWAYANLTPLYSYQELACMDDDQLEALIDGLAYECPDCGGLHDGTTTGTERCPACEHDAE